MLGDLFDVKRSLVTLFTSASFMATVQAVVADKGDGISPVLPAGAPTVLPYERLTKQVPLPLCEFIGYQSTYGSETVVKQATHRIGARWSVIEATEELATRSVEVFMTASVITLFGDNTSRNSLLADVTVHAGPVIVTEEDFAPMAPSGDAANPFLKWAILVFEVTTWRD